MNQVPTRFAKPVFRGGRFESNALPVDVLPDLAAYRDLVVELAKHLFLLREPARQRVPKGFVESFQLAVRAVEPGSAGAVLERLPLEQQMPVLFPATDLFDEARDLIAAVVSAAGSKRPLPPAFPPHLAKRFNQFGRGLRDEEYVELHGPGEEAGPRYDRSIRKRIVVQQEGRYEDKVDVVGVLSGGVIDREQITVRLEDGGLIDGRCPQVLVRDALEFVERRVRMLGVGLYDRNDRLERVLWVDDVSLADENENQVSSSLDVQFDELKRLPPGWFDEGTPALDPIGVESFRSFLHGLLSDFSLPLPYVYPTPEGNARAEWSFPDWEVSATAYLAEHSITLHATHLRSDAYQERELSIRANDAATSFAKFIRQFMPARVNL